MIAGRSSNQIWRLLIQLELFAAVLLASAEETPFQAESENDPNLTDGILAEKRYLAAMAKNGRLPKFAASEKREEGDFEKPAGDKGVEFDSPNDVWVDEKRHVGAFLKTHGKPNFGNRGGERRSAPFDEDNFVESLESEEKAGKRNVASLARLGRLNAVRFGRFQPQYFGGKKRVNIYNEAMNDGGLVKSDNEITADTDCEEEEIGNQSNAEDNYIYPNWMQSQQKRYVAALARSGRLPVWHTQRMWWGGKRDIPNPYWSRYRSGARTYGGKRKNSNSDSRLVELKNKRCKKLDVVNEDTKIAPQEKKNLPMLARKGLLLVRPYASV